MASVVGRSALRAARPLRTSFQTTRPRFASSTNVDADIGAEREVLKKGARRDPELYVLLAVMSGAFGLAGWYFSSNPTTGNSETRIVKAYESEPWKTGRASVYQYHPGGDTSQAPKDAPSALNVIIVPNVTLPKELHEKFNKYGKEGY